RTDKDTIDEEGDMRKLPLACLLAPLSWAQLPDAPGRELVERVCSACHSLSRFADLRMDAASWRDKVRTMMGPGADATPAEAEVIIAFLAKNLGAAGQAPPAETKAAAPEAKAAPRELPEGPGKLIIQRDCVGCHNGNSLSTYQHTSQEWTAI